MSTSFANPFLAINEYKNTLDSIYGKNKQAPNYRLKDPETLEDILKTTTFVSKGTLFA